MKFEKLYDLLELYILKNWGDQCPDFELNCMNCQQYLALHILEENIWLEKSKGKKES